MSKGRFGIHGGQYVPETIMNAVNELEATYNKYKDDPEFNRELTELYNEYAGRPSRLYYAERMSKDLGGAKIYLKREDLNHTGSHKINNFFEFIGFIPAFNFFKGISSDNKMYFFINIVLFIEF